MMNQHLTHVPLWCRRIALCLGGVLVACVLLVAPLRVAHAQAWTQPQGNVYTKASFGLSMAAEQYLFDGSTKSFFENVDKGLGAFQDASFYLYTEAGLLDFLTFSFSLPYKRIFMEDDTFRYYTGGVGDITAGLRLSLQHFAKIPKISALAFNLNVSLPTGYTTNYFPPIGAGQIQVQGMLNYGQGFYPVPMYLQVGVGYQTRLPFRVASRFVECAGGEVGCIPDTGEAPKQANELVVTLELGATPTKWLLIQALTKGVFSFAEPEAGVQPLGAAPLPAQRFLQVGAAITLYPFVALPSLARLGVSAQFMGTLWGQATNRALTFMFGIEYQFNFKKIR